MEHFYTYIVTNKKNGVLYTGITTDLDKVIEEKEFSLLSETSRLFDINRIVWFEEFGTEQEAFFRESELNSWNRIKKIDLIESLNPDWENLPVQSPSSDSQ